MGPIYTAPLDPAEARQRGRIISHWREKVNRNFYSAARSSIVKFPPISVISLVHAEAKQRKGFSRPVPVPPRQGRAGFYRRLPAPCHARAGWGFSRAGRRSGALRPGKAVPATDRLGRAEAAANMKSCRSSRPELSPAMRPGKVVVYQVLQV